MRKFSTKGRFKACDFHEMSVPTGVANLLGGDFIIPEVLDQSLLAIGLILSSTTVKQSSLATAAAGHHSLQKITKPH